MISPKLIQILRSRTELTDEEIIKLDEISGWDIVRKLDEEKKALRLANYKPTICFTGFSLKEKKELQELAIQRGMKPVSGVSNLLEYLVIGETPGETKIQKAKEALSKILSRKEFEELDFSKPSTDDPIPERKNTLEDILNQIICEGDISSISWEQIKTNNENPAVYQVFLSIKDTDQFQSILKPNRYGDLEYSINYLKEKIRNENIDWIKSPSIEILDQLFILGMKKHFGSVSQFKSSPLSKYTYKSSRKYQSPIIDDLSSTNLKVLSGIVSIIVVMFFMIAHLEMSETDKILKEAKEKKEQFQQQ